MARMGRIVAVVLIVLAAAAYVVVQLVRPVPTVSADADTVSVTLPGSPPALAWPSGGEAAIGVSGAGVLAAHGSQTPTPLASVTKMMTAYVVLHDHPIGATGQGPDIPVGATAVATYQQDVAAGDSVVAVEAGEQLSEVQALEGLLVPSGDNIASLLADWDAGSETAFVAKMNADAKALGLTGTTYADSSGVDPGSVSTAQDQVKLAMADMANATFASVVAMAQVTLPVAGVQYNVDSQLGKNGIIGIKTGWTEEAGGCFVFAADVKAGGGTQQIVGAVLDQGATASAQSALTNAFTAAQALLSSADHSVERTTVVRAGSVLGHLHAPWAPTVALSATRSVTVTGFAGEHVATSVVLAPKVTPPLAAHHRFGALVVQVDGRSVRVPLRTSRALPGASIGWRLTNV